MSDFEFLFRADFEIGKVSGPWKCLLNWRVWATVKSSVSFRRAGTVVQCGSAGPSLEAVWARALGTDVWKHKIGVRLAPRGWHLNCKL